MNIENIPILPAYLGVTNVGVMKNWKPKVDEFFYKTNLNNQYSPTTTITEEKSIHQMPAWKPLGDIGLRAANQWIKMIGYDTDLFMTSSWINKYTPGDVVYKHIHYDSFLSGVYYFEDCSSIVFAESPHKSLFVSGIEKIKEQTFTYTPRAGDLVLFLSYTHHLTLPSDQLRYSFAFDCYPKNMNFTKKYNEYKLKLDHVKANLQVDAKGNRLISDE